MKPVFTLAMLGLLACGLSACQPDNSQAKKSSPPAVTITTAPLSQRPLEARIGSLASIEAVNSPQVLAEVAGRVAAVAVDVGAQVKPGQLLLTLDPADLRNSKLAQDAEVARLGALADQQRRNVVRYRDLLTQGFISDAKMDELVAQQQAIEQQWAAAKAQAANSQRMVDKAQVRAPVAGAIDTRLVNVGEYVTVGKPLFTLASGGALRARFALSGREAASVKPGLLVRLETDGERLSSHISETRPAIDARNGMIEALAPLPADGPWRAGLAVHAEVVLAERQGLAAPQVAVIERPAGSTVYVVKGDHVEARRVRVGIRQDGWVELLDGVQPGETLAVDGAGFLTDKAKVKLAKPDKDKPGKEKTSKTEAKP
ncbi:efflux RND transporter periplasmic adaptor subunit [Rivihabitans pingtungensis]|uniref:RND family efflux transporter MFP subunit n=1 Tax=Rivihabitans pingtungensis TaxID=1054498 RepID=A0A318KDN7_9NEIS|nr:efflux RND transporter periplasmic adaptor subunit [Rivihabitans pingtungensis]PXX75086.1 RND family efflux transporter MFP subunit [Rivihabitans pingtungensis]